MRIGIGQLAVSETKKANLEAIARDAAHAARDGVALVVFPEMAMYFKHGLDRSFIDQAEAVPGPFTDAVDAIARTNGIAVVVGMVERTASGDRAYNTIYATSAEGSTLGRYRKVHLYDAFGLRESDVVAPSEDLEPSLFELQGLRFGIMTCYDLRFPESARTLVDAGADVIVLPSAWTPGVRKEDHWSTLARARAIENTTYVIAANQAPPLSTGGSLIIDPMGIVVGELGERAALAAADISKDRLTEVRASNPSVSNRRFRVERLTPAPVA